MGLVFHHRRSTRVPDDSSTWHGFCHHTQRTPPPRDYKTLFQLNRPCPEWLCTTNSWGRKRNESKKNTTLSTSSKGHRTVFTTSFPHHNNIDSTPHTLPLPPNPIVVPYLPCHHIINIERSPIFVFFLPLCLPCCIFLLLSFLQMVNAPKKKNTHCKKCRKHTEHKVTQYKAGKASNFAQGKRRYDRKQQGFGGQTKPIFHKKAKTTKKITLRLECKVCKAKSHQCIKRCKSFQLGAKKATSGHTY